MADIYCGMLALSNGKACKLGQLPKSQPLPQPDKEKLLIQEIFRHQICEGSITFVAHDFARLEGPVPTNGEVLRRSRCIFSLIHSYFARVWAKSHKSGMYGGDGEYERFIQTLYFPH